MPLQDDGVWPGSVQVHDCGVTVDPRGDSVNAGKGPHPGPPWREKEGQELNRECGIGPERAICTGVSLKVFQPYSLFLDSNFSLKPQGKFLLRVSVPVPQSG